MNRLQPLKAKPGPAWRENSTKQGVVTTRFHCQWTDRWGQPCNTHLQGYATRQKANLHYKKVHQDSEATNLHCLSTASSYDTAKPDFDQSGHYHDDMRR
eukprot:g58850.t1